MRLSALDCLKLSGDDSRPLISAKSFSICLTSVSMACVSYSARDQTESLTKHDRSVQTHNAEGVQRWPTHGGSVLQLRQRSGEALLNGGHLPIGFHQLFLKSRDVADLRHFLQDGAEALQSGSDLRRVVQHRLPGKFCQQICQQSQWDEGRSTEQHRSHRAAHLQSADMAAQTLCRGVGAGSRQPGLSLGHPAVGAVDHLLVLLKPRLNLSGNTNSSCFSP